MLTESWARLAETLLKILAKIGGLFAAFLAGKETVKKDQMEVDLERAEHDAKAWANRPSGADTVDRLRALAAKKRDNRP